MNSWDELRTALYVHEMGSVSAAATALGVHRATVIRHIDSLEHELKVAIFRRSATGYVATEIGAETLAAAKQAEKLFTGAYRKIRGEVQSSTKIRLTVSVVPPFAPLVLPTIGHFLRQRTDVTIDFQSSDHVTRLDLGEADLAVRAGPRPKEPGYLVQPFVKLALGIYATRDYIAKRGAPTGIDDLGAHLAIGPNANPHMPFAAWSRRHLPSNNLRLTVENGALALDCTLAGAGVGILPDITAELYPELKLLFRLPDALDEMLWLVAHESNKELQTIMDLAESLRSNSIDLGSDNPAVA